MLTSADGDAAEGGRRAGSGGAQPDLAGTAVDGEVGRSAGDGPGAADVGGAPAGGGGPPKVSEISGVATGLLTVTGLVTEWVAPLLSVTVRVTW